MIAFFGTGTDAAAFSSPSRSSKRPKAPASARTPARSTALSTVVLTPVRNVGRMKMLLSGMRSYLWSGLVGRR